MHASAILILLTFVLLDQQYSHCASKGTQHLFVFGDDDEKGWHRSHDSIMINGRLICLG